MLKKKFRAKFKRLIELLPTKLSKIWGCDPRCGTRK